MEVSTSKREVATAAAPIFVRSETTTPSRLERHTLYFFISHDDGAIYPVFD